MQWSMQHQEEDKETVDSILGGLTALFPLSLWELQISVLQCFSLNLSKFTSQKGRFLSVVKLCFLCKKTDKAALI